MADLGTLTANLSADASSFQRGVGQAIGMMDDLAAKVPLVSGGMAAVGTAVTGAGLAAAATAQEAAKLEQSLAGAAARADATSQTMTRFGEAARQASLDSAFGANEAAGGLRFLAKSGFEAQEATEALPAILQGATAAGMGVAEMGEIASNALRAFGKSTSETEGVMDVLVKASTSANTSVQELGQGISVVGGLASSAGQSLEGTVSIIASMQDAGVGASRAATALRAGISKLLSPTKDGKKALDDLGISARDSSGNLRSMTDILADLESAGASSEQMLEIFGQRAGPTLQTALGQGTDALKNLEGNLESAGGTSQRVSGFMKDTLTEQLNILGGSLQTLAANVGDNLLPALTEFVGLLNSIVSGANTVVDAIEGMFTDNFISATEHAGQATKETAESTKKQGQEADRAAEKNNKYAQSARKATEQVKAQENAQDALNRSMGEFQDLTLEEQQESMGELSERVTQLEQDIPQARSHVQDLQGTLEALQQRREQAEGIEAVQLGTKIDRQKSQLQDARSTLSEMEREHSRLREQMEESVDAVSGRTVEQQEALKMAKAEHRVANASTKLERERAEHARRMLSIRQSTEDHAVREEKLGAQRAKHERRINELMSKRSTLVEETPGLEEGQPDTQRAGFATGQAVQMGGASATRGGGLLPGEGEKVSRETEETKKQSEAEREKQREMQRTADVQQTQIQQSEDMTRQLNRSVGAAGQAATSVLKIADAGREATSAVSGIGRAVQGVVSGLASGGPAGILGAISAVGGGIASLISGGGRGGGRTRAASQQRDRKKFAKLLADRLGRVIDDTVEPTRDVNIDARGALVGTEQEVAKKITDLTRSELERLEGVRLG